MEYIFICIYIYITHFLFIFAKIKFILKLNIFGMVLILISYFTCLNIHICSNINISNIKNI